LALVAPALQQQHGLVLVLPTQVATVHVSFPLFCTSFQCLCMARPWGARGTHSLGATTSLAMPCPRGAATYLPIRRGSATSGRLHPLGGAVPVGWPCGAATH
jgi:hypothetical protein